jgi:DNA-binding MarR family transcriptional regulator
MEAYTNRLGELQQKILKHMFECTAETDNPNHIANELGIKQPTVYESVQLLMKDDYLKAEQKHKRGPKSLTLTDKGAAAAVLLGIDITRIQNYEKRRNSNLVTEAFTYYGKIITTPEKRMFIFKKAMMYVLKNNIFKEGYFRKYTPEEEKGFQRYLMIEYMNSLGPASNIQDLKEFFDRYQLDKEFLKESLTGQKN